VTRTAGSRMTTLVLPNLMHRAGTLVFVLAAHLVALLLLATFTRSRTIAAFRGPAASAVDSAAAGADRVQLGDSPGFTASRNPLAKNSGVSVGAVAYSAGDVAEQSE
jgi:hypothetical protein